MSLKLLQMWPFLIVHEDMGGAMVDWFPVDEATRA